MRIQFIENKGIRVGETGIMLGSDIGEVRNTLGHYDVFENDYYFIDGNLMICTDDQGMIRQIEVRNSEDDTVEAVFDHVDLFKEEKPFILSYFENLNGSPLRYECGAFVADQLGVSFSFGMSEHSIEELIQESKKDGVYEEMKDEIEQDLYRSKHLQAFCIGS